MTLAPIKLEPHIILRHAFQLPSDMVDQAALRNAMLHLARDENERARQTWGKGAYRATGDGLPLGDDDA